MTLIENLKSKNITLTHNGEKVSLEDINEVIPFDFIDKENLINFYTSYNGGVFEEKIFFPYEFENNKYNLIIEGFYKFSSIDFKKILSDSIEKIILIRSGYSEEFDDFMDFHFPFAYGAGGDFWIDIQTGEVKFSDYELEGYNTEAIITVASSFSDFCMKLFKK